MPRKARKGRIEKLASGRYSARWYDENGVRRRQGGFARESDAGEWLDRKLDEVAALKRGDRPPATEIPTVNELVRTFLATHDVDPATIDKLRYELKHATRAFGDRRVDTLRPSELAEWRTTLPARSRHQLFRSFRQVLEQAVTWQQLERNPTDRIRNRRVKLDEDREIRPFTDWAEVEAIADELHPAYRALPLFLVGTGMRPEEALALEWRDVDKSDAIASVERVYSQGRVKPCKKSDRQRRRVPLRAKVLEVLEQHPRRIDTRLVFPSRDGEYLKLPTFRLRHWTPALRAAGVDHRSVYTCRHTFASWSLQGGVSLFHLSRIMGTSIAMLDAHYGHLVPDSEDYLRGLLDAYDRVDVQKGEVVDG
jgi:integrase